MYHIKPDPRCLRTVGEITRGLLECLREKPLSAVTVTDIHRVTGVSRATFYRLFDNTEDVLEYLCNLPQEESDSLFAGDLPDSPGQMFTKMLELGLENHDLLKALVDNGRYDLLYRYAEQRFRMMRSMYPGSIPELDEAAGDYMISALAMNMVSTLVTWIRRGRTDTPEEIARYTSDYLKTLMALVE